MAVVHNLWHSEFSPTKIAYRADVSGYSSRAGNRLRNAWSESSFAGGGSAAGSAFALGGTNQLSKRTRLYAAMLDGGVEAGGAATLERRLYAIGVRHDF